MTDTHFIPLEDIRIAKPCRADWDAMSGDERARFCDTCHKNVYDISHMTRQEATELIRSREGDVCLRLHRRFDGTVITSDCPVGKSTARRPFLALIAGFAALLGSGLAVAGPRQTVAGPSGQETLAQRFILTPLLGTLEKLTPTYGRRTTMGSPSPGPGYVPPTVAAATTPTSVKNTNFRKATTKHSHKSHRKSKKFR